MLRILELTIPFETTLNDAAERKETRYKELVQSAQQAGYTTALITIEVGARGVPHMAGFQMLKHELLLTKNEFSLLLHQIAQEAIEGSFRIWGSRNKTMTSTHSHL